MQRAQIINPLMLMLYQTPPPPTSISVCRGRGVIVMTCEMNLQFKCRWRLGGLGCMGGIDVHDGPRFVIYLFLGLRV